MALYTAKGDSGKTSTYGCNQKISKSSAVAEALGALDEINSFLGLCKVKSAELKFSVAESGPTFEYLIHFLQDTLFSVQAEVAGFPKHIDDSKVKDMEKIIDDIEKQLPPIKTFFISGGSELAALFDIARTVARRAERRVVAVHDEGKVKLGEHTLPFLNRLSSILYALARLSNHKSGITEKPPVYA